MDAKVLSPPLRPKPTLLPHKPNPPFRPLPSPRTITFRPASLNTGGPAPASDDTVNPAGDDGSVSKSHTNSSSSTTAKAAAQPRQPAGKLGIRYRSISRKQARRQQQQQGAAPPPPPAPPKTWEEMTLGEKAVELYMGEKGMLFWLNKFAYASIFIVIGGWILFRFVGPSLGLYQLDAPPLSVSSVFKG